MLIIYHWDTDGICSASLLYDKYDELFLPKIGNYFLTDKEIEEIKEMGQNEICIVDFALNEDSLKKLKKIAKIKIIDHHLTKKIDGIEYINPIIEGKDEQKYPSSSWIVNEYLGNKENLLAFLGVVGDWEKRIIKTRFYKKLKKFMENNKIKFEEMLEMVKLIDSNYKVGDIEEIKRAVYILKDMDKEEILNNKKWKKNKEMVDNEIEKALNGKEKRIGKILIKEIDCKYNVISSVARKLWEKNEYVIVINKGYFKNDCQIYVRGKNIFSLVKLTKKYVYGGKKNVIGAIIPKKECNEFVKYVVKCIENA